jgi:hypothetical protein
MNVPFPSTVKTALRVAVISVFLSCRRQPVNLEPPPNWKWADVGQACTPGSPAYELPAAARDSLGAPFGSGTQDPWAERAAIARTIPGGWGGLESRESGHRFGIYLQDTTQRSAAISALQKAGVQFISADRKVVQGRWTYGQLYDWFRYIHSHLRRVPVNSWALDEWRNRIYYGTVDEAAGLELDRQLTALNVPCFLVAREVVGEIHVNE